MNKEKIISWGKQKLDEWINPENEKYQLRQKLQIAQDEKRAELKKQIRYYSFSGIGDEVMENMKTLLILIFLFCGAMPFIFMFI